MEEECVLFLLNEFPVYALMCKVEFYWSVIPHTLHIRILWLRGFIRYGWLPYVNRKYLIHLLCYWSDIQWFYLFFMVPFNEYNARCLLLLLPKWLWSKDLKVGYRRVGRGEESLCVHSCDSLVKSTVNSAGAWEMKLIVDAGREYREEECRGGGGEGGGDPMNPTDKCHNITPLEAVALELFALHF